MINRSEQDQSASYFLSEGELIDFLMDTHTRALGKFSHVVSRRKTEEKDEGGGGPQLARVLGFFDLTLLGVGSTLGVGVYVLAGAVAKTDSGPAVVIAFLVAAIASAFAGLCYAEFAARVPKAGSAYVYSYVTVGELTAFVIGWNLILEYVIGTASVARAFSNYIDSLVSKAMSEKLTELMPLHVSFLSPYPDFLSFGIVLVLTVLLAWGVKESALMNNIFTALNLLTVIIVIVAGLFKVDAKNWAIPKSQLTPQDKGGEGGFMPFGISGIMAGAAKCFFGFVGFDCVATTGEEAKNPQRHIPLAIVTSLIIIFLSYFGISTVLTMMWPYYLQDTDAPLVHVFNEVGMPAVRIIVSTGAIFALCTSLIGSLFPMPRLLYAMAGDGLLFRLFAIINSKTHTALYSTIITGIVSGQKSSEIAYCMFCSMLGCMLPAPRLLYGMGKDRILFHKFSSVHPHTRTPLVATLITGAIAGIMGALFNLEQLIDMMSIGTLLAYTIVALCVLLLRYRNPIIDSEARKSGYMKQIFNLDRLKRPDRVSTIVAEVAVFNFIVYAIITTFCLVYFEDVLPEGDKLAVIVTSVFFVLTVCSVGIIALQPQDQPTVFFKVPFLPILPCLSIFVNIYLMMKLDVNTWVRFAIWLIVGGLIYIFYSIPNSVEGKKEKMAKENPSLYPVGGLRIQPQSTKL